MAMCIPQFCYNYTMKIAHQIARADAFLVFLLSWLNEQQTRRDTFCMVLGYLGMYSVRSCLLSVATCRPRKVKVTADCQHRGFFPTGGETVSVWVTNFSGRMTPRERICCRHCRQCSRLWETVYLVLEGFKIEYLLGNKNLPLRCKVAWWTFLSMAWKAQNGL
jgi:hypothetical protein